MDIMNPTKMYTFVFDWSSKYLVKILSGFPEPASSEPEVYVVPVKESSGLRERYTSSMLGLPIEIFKHGGGGGDKNLRGGGNSCLPHDNIRVFFSKNCLLKRGDGYFYLYLAKKLTE